MDPFSALCAVAGGVVAVVAAPVALGAAGFTSAGIVAGSIGAKMMSAAAIANGGGVAVGSVVAGLQSAGATGLSGAASAAVATVGGSRSLAGKLHRLRLFQDSSTVFSFCKGHGKCLLTKLLFSNVGH
ncbi:uncharacterized protein LKV04_018068 isoform 1-T1 [Tautogolabrus adspersus]